MMLLVVMVMVTVTLMVMVMVMVMLLVVTVTKKLWMLGAPASPDLVSNASKSGADIKIHPVPAQH